MTASSETYQQMAEAMSDALESGMQPTATPPPSTAGCRPSCQLCSNSLQAGSYEDFTAHKSAIHPSRGPHAKFGWPVQVFMDPTIDESLRAGNESHLVGSSIAKEMYSESGQLAGWAVMVKIQEDSADGQGWFWYETSNTSDSGTS